MNIVKDGKTLYFSDDEISNDSDGEKKVFVTKRINGKETHIKQKKENNEPNEQQKRELEQKDTFNFDNEIVIGVDLLTKKKDEPKNNNKTNKNNKPKHSKEKNKEQTNKKIRENKKKVEKNLQQKKSQKNHTKNSKQIKKNNYNTNTKQPREKEYQYNTQKNKKQKKHSKMPITIFTTIILISIVIIFALTAPIFNITNIEVTGNNQISTDTIISLSRFAKRRKYF